MVAKKPVSVDKVAAKHSETQTKTSATLKAGGVKAREIKAAQKSMAAVNKAVQQAK